MKLISFLDSIFFILRLNESGIHSHRSQANTVIQIPVYSLPVPPVGFEVKLEEPAALVSVLTELFGLTLPACRGKDEGMVLEDEDWTEEGEVKVIVVVTVAAIEVV